MVYGLKKVDVARLRHVNMAALSYCLRFTESRRASSLHFLDAKTLCLQWSRCVRQHLLSGGILVLMSSNRSVGKPDRMAV